MLVRTESGGEEFVVAGEAGGDLTGAQPSPLGSMTGSGEGHKGVFHATRQGKGEGGMQQAMGASLSAASGLGL